MISNWIIVTVSLYLHCICDYKHNKSIVNGLERSRGGRGSLRYDTMDICGKSMQASSFYNQHKGLTDVPGSPMSPNCPGGPGWPWWEQNIYITIQFHSWFQSIIPFFPIC